MHARRDGVRALYVAPWHMDDPDWPWITGVAPISRHTFTSRFIDSTFRPVPKLTGIYRRWQIHQARRAMRDADITFTFSVDLCRSIGAAPKPPGTRLVYVGFTQDSAWPDERIVAVARSMHAYDAITVFTDEERDVYLDRFDLDPARVHTIPIHTDEPDGYGRYADDPPTDRPYVWSMGSPNRRFLPVAEACKHLDIPLVIITRPWHAHDDLETLAEHGAEIITDAGKQRALAYLKHARLAAMTFDDPGIPGGFTTLLHGMFMRTPFVITSCLGVSEHIVHGETGFVTPHDDQDALSAAIESLWSSPELADRFGDAGLDRAESRHSLRAASSRFDALIDHVLERRAAAPVVSR